MNTQLIPGYSDKIGRLEPAESCGTCALGRVSSGKMPGWINCVYDKSHEFYEYYEFLAPHRGCKFSPSRYVAQKATIDAKKATV